MVRNGDAVGSGRPPLHSDSGGSVTSGGSVSSASELLMSPAGGAALRMTLPPMASSAFVQDLEVSAAVCDLNNCELFENFKQGACEHRFFKLLNFSA